MTASCTTINSIQWPESTTHKKKSAANIIKEQAATTSSQQQSSTGQLVTGGPTGWRCNPNQALCHKNGYGFVDGPRELMGMLKADSVHPTKRGSQLQVRLQRAAIKQASEDLEVSHNGALQQQHQREKDHKKLRFQRGDQSEGLAQYWNNVTNFPALSTDPMLVAAPASPCEEMWSDVARTSDSATIQCHSAMTATPKVAETDTTHGWNKPREACICYAFVQQETSEILVFPRDIPLFESCRRGEVQNCGNGQDLNKMNVIKQLLPKCRILLCSWHVLKYLHTKVMQHKSNRLDKKYVKDIFTKLVFAHNVDIYEEHLQDLEEALEEYKTLLEYFYKNWHSCKTMWIHAYRANACSLGNNTNNRMESQNQKL
ncbi:hypothetical protein HPB51_023602 [Rhipicephalus microplus]|uniref:MULE transposase domain-containing protein n=1 Tax=Rhipicephalus microplus TaxID=6941 RepID=A0A9J6DKJ5_RHIMP|nr:hypothetical protein HPB51_023602 [Rhipicephalus microplus]